MCYDVAMPRRARVSKGGYVYHVMNQAAGRWKICRKEADYAAFEQVIEETYERLPMRILSYCLLPTSWQMVLWPRKDHELSEFMRLLTVKQTRRWHAQNDLAGSGALYRGRFKSFPVQPDDSLLLACRSVEGSALVAKEVDRAEAWPWGSAFKRRQKDSPAWLLADEHWPVNRPTNWVSLLNRPMQEQEIERVRVSVVRGRPLGQDKWVMRTARALSLESTLRPRGRPRKLVDE